MRVSQITCANIGIPINAQPPGEFEGGGVAPIRGSAERSGAPKGELDSPLEVPRLCEILGLGTYETEALA